LILRISTAPEAGASLLTLRPEGSPHSEKASAKLALRVDFAATFAPEGRAQPARAEPRQR
jgi:hypothetical protein